MSLFSFISSPHALVDRHFGEGTRLRSPQTMWRHLETCDACRERYRAHSLMESLEPNAQERSMNRLAPAALGGLNPRTAIRWQAWSFGLVAACAALWFVAMPSHRVTEFQERGSAPHADEPSLRVFSVGATANSESPVVAQNLVTDSISSADGLAFSYTNIPSSGYAYLMVFAVAANGHVAWFWPAWQTSAADPSAVAISSGDASAELTEAVFHDFPVGTLSIHGLFLATPTTVKSVEAIIAKQSLQGLDALENSFHWSQTVQVKP